jgi:hypothetical protein
MPAKSKPKSRKAVKRAVRKPISKGVKRASFSQVVKPISIEPPAAEPPVPDMVPTIAPQQPPVAETPSPPEPITPAPSVPPPPVSQPVENLEQILDTDAKDSAADRKNHVVFILGIVFAIALIAGAVGVFVVYLGSSKAPKQISQKASVTPTPTPTPEFVRSRISFEVINASGVSGAATKGAGTLTKAGYTVLSVGNGGKQATSSILLAGSLTSTEVSEILADMNSLFSVSSPSGDLNGTTASARLILGAH